MKPSSSLVGFVVVEAAELMRLCIDRLRSTGNQQDLVLNGTMPKEDLKAISSQITLTDPNGIGGRFKLEKPIFLEGWSELFSIACLCMYANSHSKEHWKVGIGLEGAYEEPSTRERYLADGALVCDALNAYQVFQETKAQNIKGKSNAASVQQEIIENMRKKLKAEHSDEPVKGLVVTVFGTGGPAHKIDLKEIFDSTLKKYGSVVPFKPVFCIFCIFDRGSIARARIFRLDVAGQGMDEVVSASYEIAFKSQPPKD